MNPTSIRRFLCALLLLPALAAGGGAAAQSPTATLRGFVRDDAGAPIPGATVAAVETQTGFRRAAATRADGGYNLGGLLPGTYQIRVSGLGREAQSRTLRLMTGQILVADWTLRPEAVVLEGLNVVGGVALETRTSEVGTSITQEQIESLPQQDRNFLNFAGLAPGITASRVEDNKNISAGGLGASKINVFIDGTSFKNDVLEGGVHGQDASRGNPFPQLAIKEFRVITQNFKAEYQHAASAVVTATTRSGTNDFEVGGFVLGQNKDFVARNAGALLECRRATADGRECVPKPEYERLQGGITVGGPILRDRLHYFAGYETNLQNRQAIVTLGPQAPAAGGRFDAYRGTFDQPFRSHLAFGKLSWQPAGDQTLELSYNGRFESDKRNFGGTTSFESAEDLRIGYNVLTLQHTLSRGSWLNQAHVSAQRSTWNPTAVNDDQDIGLQYDDIIRIGARSTEQRFVQDRLAFRNDVTYSGLRFLGDHVVKAGVSIDFLNYEVAKRFDGNPTFFFRPSNLDVPYRASYGEGDPGMDASNAQFGLYVQSDWDVTSRLQLNVGVRWDAERNLFNNDWVTPDSIRSQIMAWNVPDSIQAMIGQPLSNYLTRGREDRPMFLGAIQPRLGLSFDVFGNGRTVVHGGFGVYYDREIWNRLLDERFRLQWRVRSFEFTTDPQAEPNKIPWQDEYLSRQGLDAIIADGTYGRTGEVFLLDNDTKPTYTHQFSVGVRQAVGPTVVSAGYRGVRGHNVFSWYCATPDPVHGYCGGAGNAQGLAAGYGLLLSTDEGRTWYDALDLTVDKPFTRESPWGFTLAYTVADAERKGMDFFTLDFPLTSPENWPRVDQPIEKHRVVASAIVGLPFDVRLSSVMQWGSGIRYNIRDETNEWGPRRVQVDWAGADAPNFSQVDLRLQKDIRTGGDGKVGLIAEVVNLFNEENFREYEGLAYFAGTPDGQGGRIPRSNPNASFGQPLSWTSDTGRRLQLGVDFRF
jgi:hypothetical protein